MNEKDYRQDLLEYTRSIRQRREDLAAKQGFSIWGLYVAIVYLVWALVPQASEVLNVENNNSILIAIFTHTHMALIAFCAYLTGVSARKPKSIFDYRIEGEDSHLEYGNLILITIIFTLLPACSSYMTLKSDLSIGDFQRIQLWINLILSGLFSLTFLIAIPYEEYYRKKNKLPLINLLPSKTSDRVSSAYVSLCITLLFIGNSVVIFDYVLVNPQEWLMTFNLSLLLIAITGVSRLQMQKETLYDLNNLERDIVLHDLDKSEIIKRLEKSVLGHQLGDWLDSLSKNVNEKSTLLVESIQGIEKFIEEINSIDPSYTSERKARLDNFIDELKSKLEKFEREVTPLLNWYILAEKRIHKIDPEVVSILNKNRENLSRCAKKNTELFSKSIDKLEALYSPQTK